MPLLINHKDEHAQVNIALCSEESAEWLQRLPENLHLADDFVAIRVAARQREWLTSRALLYELDGCDAAFDLQKDVFGKPFLAHRADTYISLSHSNDYCAVIRADKPCGIDIQYFTPKMVRISDRFMRPDEWEKVQAAAKHEPDSTEAALHFYWSAKEAIYKAWGTKNLSAQRIHILSSTKGVIVGAQEQIIKIYTLKQQKNSDYECVWAIEASVSI